MGALKTAKQYQMNDGSMVERLNGGGFVFWNFSFYDPTTSLNLLLLSVKQKDNNGLCIMLVIICFFFNVIICSSRHDGYFNIISAFCQLCSLIFIIVALILLDSQSLVNKTMTLY